MRFCDVGQVENKQRLNLSHWAGEVLARDAEAFRVQARLGEGGISSGMVNQVFRTFCRQADASVAMALGRERQELNELFADLDAGAAARASALCLSAAERRLADRATRLLEQKGESFSFRIDKENLAFLASDEGQAEAAIYRDGVGRYFKAVLEEYCQLPYVRRERIFFGPLLDQVRLAADEKKMLRFTLYGGRNKGLYMKPLGCEEDMEHLYNYVVGMTAFSPEGPWRPGAVRLTSIQACVRQAGSGFLSAGDRRQIREAVRRQGVQYLPEEGAIRVVVRLTSEGEKMYRHLMHLRPQYIARDGAVYTFCCTFRQADNYFFKFGAHARVLEPESLAELFARRYRSAARAYG